MSGGASRSADPCWAKVSHLEGCEGAKLIELEVGGLADVFPDCSIERDDSAVMSRLECSEEGLDVASIGSKLFLAVWVHVRNGVRCQVECMVPFEARGDGLRSSAGSAG